MASWHASRNKFSVEEAREMMIRDGSSLREIRVAGISYKVRRPPSPRHELPETNVIHRAAGYQSSIPKTEPRAESSRSHKTIVEGSTVGRGNSMRVTLPLCITFPSPRMGLV